MTEEMVDKARFGEITDLMMDLMDKKEKAEKKPKEPIQRLSAIKELR